MSSYNQNVDNLHQEYAKPARRERSPAERRDLWECADQLRSIKIAVWVVAGLAIAYEVLAFLIFVVASTSRHHW
jgi:hypothetical protein